MMKTTVDKTKKEKINWLLSCENQADMDISVEDFRQMVREAERGEGMSLPAYKENSCYYYLSHDN